MDFFNLADERIPTGQAELARGEQSSLLETAGLSVVRGGVRVAGASLIAAGGLASLFSEGVGDDIFRTYDEVIVPKIESLTPDAEMLSTTGQIINAVGEFAAPIATGPFVLPTMIGTEAFNTGVDLVKQGVDPLTATATGVIGGVATGLMMKVPATGKTLKQTLALIGINPVIGGVQTAVQREVLEARGEFDVAQQFDPYDPTARGIDLVMGVIFGGMAHYARARTAMPTEAKDAIDVTAEAQSVSKSNIIEGKNRTAHEAALNETMRNLTEGNPIDLTSNFRGIGLSERTGVNSAIKALENTRRTKDIPRGTKPAGLLGGLAESERPDLNFMMVKPDADATKIREASVEFDAGIVEEAKGLIEQPAKPTKKRKKKAKTLTDFIRSNIVGGLNLEKEALASDVRARFSRKEGISGIINRKGKGVDDATQMAISFGYLPEGSTVNDFMAALTEDVDFKTQGTGKPVFSMEDVDTVLEAENKRLLDEYYAEEETRYAEIEAERAISEAVDDGDPSAWSDADLAVEASVVAQAADLGSIPEHLLTSVEGFIETNPDTPIYTGIDERGQPIHEPAKAYIDEGKAEIEAATKKESLYDMAAECLWRG